MSIFEPLHTCYSAGSIPTVLGRFVSNKTKENVKIGTLFSTLLVKGKKKKKEAVILVG